MTTRQSRLLRAYDGFYPGDTGARAWFCEQLKVCSRVKVSRSAVYRWFDGANVVGHEALEGLLKELETDALRARLGRAQAEIDDIKGVLR